MKILLLFPLILLTNCTQKKKIESEKTFAVDYGIQAFSKLHKENDLIITTFKKCFNSNTYLDYAQYWQESDTLIFKRPFDDLWLSIEDYYPAYTPTIVSIQKKEKDKYLVKIAVMGNPEQFNSLHAIYNFYAIRDNEDIFKFKNVINDNLKLWNTKTIDNIKYIYPPQNTLNNNEIKKQIEFENNLITKFDFDKINYTYISCNSVYEFMKLRGFDYENSMFLNNQKGGVAFTNSQLIFSGNNSEFYPHELVHLYTYKYFKNINSTINEGFATYLGGSMELDYLSHIKILKDYLKTSKIDLFEYLFDDEKKFTIIGNISSIKYSAGALLCDLADKQNVLNQLLDCGKTDEELILAIESLFDINRKDFNSFIDKKLIDY